MATREVWKDSAPVEKWTNEGTAGYYSGNPLTRQRALTAAEAADLAAVDAANAQLANADTLRQQATAALVSNRTDLTQAQSISTQAAAIAATTGTRTTAQNTADIRLLAQGVQRMADMEVADKQQMNGLLRLFLGQFDGTN